MRESHAHACAGTDLCTGTCTPMRTNAYTHVHTEARSHTYTHTHMQTPDPRSSYPYQNAKQIKTVSSEFLPVHPSGLEADKPKNPGRQVSHFKPKTFLLHPTHWPDTWRKREMGEREREREGERKNVSRGREKEREGGGEGKNLLPNSV